MSQIFTFVALLGNVALLVTLWLGLQIEDASALTDAARRQVSLHFLFALGTGFFVLFVHAVVLTYFMGTGRWIQETCEAYRFTGDARKMNIRFKYRVIPGMLFCFLLVIVTGAFGAIADPGSNMQLASGASIHFGLAITTVIVNILVNVVQYQAITANSQLVTQVYEEVRQVRRERGLDPAESVEDTTST